jgi:hypothetical protein
VLTEADKDDENQLASDDRPPVKRCEEEDRSTYKHAQADEIRRLIGSEKTEPHHTRQRQNDHNNH